MELMFDYADGAEGCNRVLHNKSYLVPSDPSHFLAGQLQQFNIVKIDLSIDDRSAFAQNTHCRQDQCALAAP